MVKRIDSRKGSVNIANNQAKKPKGSRQFKKGERWRASRALPRSPCPSLMTVIAATAELSELFL